VGKQAAVTVALLLPGDNADPVTGLLQNGNEFQSCLAGQWLCRAAFARHFGCVDADQAYAFPGAGTDGVTVIDMADDGAETLALCLTGRGGLCTGKAQ
jgi:hypothetical protein